MYHRLPITLFTLKHTWRHYLRVEKKPSVVEAKKLAREPTFLSLSLMPVFIPLIPPPPSTSALSLVCNSLPLRAPVTNTRRSIDGVREKRRLVTTTGWYLSL